MLYIFRWEDILNGEIRREERIEGDVHHFVKFQLWDVAPTENVRCFILDNAAHGAVIGEILFER
jgi:hypothetical protein